MISNISKYFEIKQLMNPEKRYVKAYKAAYNTLVGRNKRYVWCLTPEKCYAKTNAVKCGTCYKINIIYYGKTPCLDHPYIDGIRSYLNDESENFADPKDREYDFEYTWKEQTPEEYGTEYGLEDATKYLKYLGWKYVKNNPCRFGKCYAGGNCQYCFTHICDWDHTSCCFSRSCEQDYFDDHGYWPYRK